MSSDTLARMHAFYIKADELADKGHLLRAAENFSRAAEAARALGEDNLVTVRMQLQQSNMLACYVVNECTGRHFRPTHPCGAPR